MFTKEELLEKGVPEKVADEILAAQEENTTEDSLQMLEKALSDKDQLPLLKADSENEEEEEEEEEYNEKYMKKYMKRYMKENKSSCGKMAKEVGIFGEKMNKAIDEIDTNVEGAVVEMADLKPFLEDLKDSFSGMVKAVSTMADQIEVISAQNIESFDVMQKAARVQVEQAKAIDTFLATPTGRKGVDSIVGMSGMEKAVGVNDIKVIHNTLSKAQLAGDKRADQIICKFESCGKNLNFLPMEDKQYINELLIAKK